MKNFRAFVNWCVKKGIIEHNPFDGFEKGEGESERYGTSYYLTLDELKVIYAADFSDKPDLAVQRDIFVFQYNIGCRVGDLNRLTKKDIINGALEYIPNKIIKENAKTVFLGFHNKTDFTERDLEQGILNHLTTFLMELGKGFAFVDRQKHMHTENRDYYIDLVFYNHILKCFVLIDFKTNTVVYQDAGHRK